MTFGTKRASPIEARKTMELAEAMKNAGIRFVPVPVFSDAELKELLLEACDKFERASQAIKEQEQ